MRLPTASDSSELALSDSEAEPDIESSRPRIVRWTPRDKREAGARTIYKLYKIDLRNGLASTEADLYIIAVPV